jgi:hypothetical protein
MEDAFELLFFPGSPTAHEDMAEKKKMLVAAKG